MSGNVLITLDLVDFDIISLYCDKFLVELRTKIYLRSSLDGCFQPKTLED